MIYFKTYESYNNEDDLIEKYSYGFCMYLALAMHDVFGWDIQAVLEDGAPYIEHAWVVEPESGRDIDIMGFGGAQDFIGYNEVVTFSRQELIDFINHDREDFPKHDELEEAMRVVFDYMIPKFNLQ